MIPRERIEEIVLRVLDTNQDSPKTLHHIGEMLRSAITQALEEARKAAVEECKQMVIRPAGHADAFQYWLGRGYRTGPECAQAIERMGR